MRRDSVDVEGSPFDNTIQIAPGESAGEVELARSSITADTSVVRGRSHTYVKETHQQVEDRETNEGSSRHLENQEVVLFGGENMDNISEGGTAPPLRASKSQEHKNLSIVSKQVLWIWWKVFVRICPTLLLNIALMSVYYLPGILLTESQLDGIYPILYGWVLFMMQMLSFWTTIGLSAIHMFSLQFTKRAFIYSITPAFLVNNLFTFLPELRDMHYGYNISNISNLFFIFVGLYIIFKEKEPNEMSERQKRFFQMTKDGSPLALAKGVTGFYAIIAFVVFNILHLTAISGLYMQLVYRFILFPMCFSLSRWFQVKVIFNLSREDMDRRLIVNKICNHMIQFTGRILVSNMSANNATSSQFILVNLFGSSIEFLSTITFSLRMRLLYRAGTRVMSLYSRLKCCRNQARLAPIIPMNELHHQETDISNHAPSTITSDEEEEYIKELTYFRVRYIYDNISSEIYSLFLAPVLMYFLYPIAPENTPFQTINSFRQCLYQVLVQLVFELVSDFLSLCYEVYQGHIQAGDYARWVPVERSLLFACSWCCLMLMHITISYNT